MKTKGQKASPVNLNTFLSTHAVFTVEEVQQFLAEHGSTNPKTRKALLTYHRSKSRILPIRRGLYASVPPGRDPATYAVDSYLVVEGNHIPQQGNLKSHPPYAGFTWNQS